MNNFTYSNPTRIHFGKGQIAKVATEIPRDARVLITYGGGSVRKNGVLAQVHSALAGFTTFEFGGIEPNPRFETLVKAVEIVKAQNIGFLLAVGGGSVLDGTKFIAAAARYPDDPWNIMSTHGAVIGSAVPLGSVLTLPATGSEMNGNAVISRGETHDKLALFSDHVRPVFSILDPEITYSLPARQTANGVVDAFVHTCEQYMTYPAKGKVQDRFAEGLLCNLLEDGPELLKNPADYDLRANMMWTATQALNDILSTGVPGDWSTHMIGHEITALYGLDHARTLAIVMPAVWSYKRGQKREKLLQYATRVLNLNGDCEDARIDGAIAKTREFFESMGVPTRLSAYGLDETAIPPVAAKLKEHGMTALGEHGDITPEAVSEMLRLAL
jgi:NADP-dependent alcohol dehydrogenase